MFRAGTGRIFVRNREGFCANREVFDAVRRLAARLERRGLWDQYFSMPGHRARNSVRPPRSQREGRARSRRSGPSRGRDRPAAAHSARCAPVRVPGIGDDVRRLGERPGDGERRGLDALRSRRERGKGARRRGCAASSPPRSAGSRDGSRRRSSRPPEDCREIAARHRREGDERRAGFGAGLHQPKLGPARPERIFRLDGGDRMDGAARLSVSGAISESPIAPIRPLSMRRLSSPTVSSIGMRRSRRWT